MALQDDFAKDKSTTGKVSVSQPARGNFELPADSD